MLLCRSVSMSVSSFSSDHEASSNEQIAVFEVTRSRGPSLRFNEDRPEGGTPNSRLRLRRPSPGSGSRERELQPHQIDQKLAPKINHAAPGIFNIAGRGLFKNAFVNVVCDLVAQILFHFSLNLLFVEGVDFSGINSVPAKKLAMTLIELPERSIRPLSIDAEERREFQAVRQRIIPCGPNLAVFGA